MIVFFTSMIRSFLLIFWAKEEIDVSPQHSITIDRRKYDNSFKYSFYMLTAGWLIWTLVFMFAADVCGWMMAVVSHTGYCLSSDNLWWIFWSSLCSWQIVLLPQKPLVRFFALVLDIHLSATLLILDLLSQRKKQND